MIRQWKPAKPTFFASMLLSRCATQAHSSLILAGAMVIAIAATAVASAATPRPTHTTLAVTTRQLPTETGSITETRLTAHVTDASGTAISAKIDPGAVSFDTDTTSLGAAMLDEGGDATINVTSLPAGSDGEAPAVHAVYHPSLGGDSSTGTALLAGSASNRALLASPRADASAPPDFTVTANPSTLVAKQGQYATAAVTITPTNGFNEQVTLSCSNLPAQATCTFSPVIASTAAGPFTSTLELQTQGASGAVIPPAFRPGAPIALGWLVPGALMLAGLARMRRKAGLVSSSAAALLLVLGALGGSLGLSGCSSRYGYEHHPPSVATGTPVGTYPAITVAASGDDGSAVTEHDITITLQVQ